MTSWCGGGGLKGDGTNEVDGTRPTRGSGVRRVVRRGADRPRTLRDKYWEKGQAGLYGAVVRATYARTVPEEEVGQPGAEVIGILIARRTRRPRLSGSPASAATGRGGRG